MIPELNTTSNWDLQWKLILLKLPKVLGSCRVHWRNGLGQRGQLNRIILETLLNGMDQKLKTSIKVFFSLRGIHSCKSGCLNKKFPVQISIQKQVFKKKWHEVLIIAP